MWKASILDMGLNKSVRHEPKRTIPANWEPRRETLPQQFFEGKKIENTKICCYQDLNSNANSLNETDSLN